MNIASKKGYFDFYTPEQMGEVVEDAGLPVTESELAAIKKYTTIRRIVVDDVPDAHAAWLRVGVQSFRLDGYSDTSFDAAWHCWMLAKALLKITEDGK